MGAVPSIETFVPGMGGDDMATAGRSGPSLLEFARGLGGLLALIGPGFFLALLVIRFGVTVQAEGNAYPALTALIVLVGAAFGYGLGVVRSHYIDGWFNDHTYSSTARARVLEFDKKKNIFLAVVWAFTCIYLGGFLMAIERFPTAQDRGWPLSYYAVGVTVATIATQMFFAARYASFVKMITGLDAIIADCRARPAAVKLAAIQQHHDAAFRDEQLYEPAGNIFVTMGITATFLGLAVGLATLDLNAIVERRDFATLYSFIGCMGLALGISMLGVIDAMAAQWLRGQGPRIDTEALLARARTMAEPPATPTR